MRYAIITLTALFFPAVVSAQVVITEIMYDLPGADGGREWVEIYNTSSSPVPIGDWWFFEDGNHGFQNADGATLGAGEYAIIADDPSAFTADNPGVTALVLDSSSFSLKNTGATVSIRDVDKVDVDSVSYTPQGSAEGDGGSLQLVSGSWVAATPTPGETNDGASAVGETDADNGNDTETEVGSDEGAGGDSNTLSFAPPDPRKIRVDAGPDMTVVAGADVVLSAEGYGTEGNLLEGLPRYTWAFGDGSTAEGKTVVHSFTFPGEYSVAVHVTSGKYNASDYVNITAEPSALAITEIESGSEGYIEVHNGSRETISLSYWLLRTPEEQFSFPPNTRIRPSARVKFPNRVTELLPAQTVELLYPNGTVAFRYTPPQASTQSPKKRLEKPAVSKSSQPASSRVEVTPVQATHNTDIDSQGVLSEESSGTTPTSTQVERERAVAILSLPASQGTDSGSIWFIVLGVLLGLAALAVVVIRSDIASAEEDLSFEALAKKDDIPRLADKITLIEDEE